jgi:hypothetical protein
VEALVATEPAEWVGEVVEVVVAAAAVAAAPPPARRERVRR